MYNFVVNDKVTILDSDTFYKKYSDEPDNHPDWKDVGYVADNMPELLGTTGIIRGVNIVPPMYLIDNLWWPASAILPRQLTTKQVNRL